LDPPTSRTRPSSNVVAVSLARAIIRLPVGTIAPLAGSNTSAVSTGEVPSKPPAISTRPSPRIAAAWLVRRADIGPTSICSRLRHRTRRPWPWCREFLCRL
jgi:hypothetical protein